MIEKDSDNFLVNPFSIDESIFDDDLEPNNMSTISQLIVHAASETVIARCKEKLPTETEVISKKLYRKTSANMATAKMPAEETRDLQISLRVSLRGLVISFVDSAPSEIGILTLKNLNAIASWNIHRTTNAAVIITVTDLQVDNMISNAPFPVAVSPIRDNASQTGAYFVEPRSPVNERPVPPVLVIGLSFAPKHKTGTVVSYLLVGVVQEIKLSNNSDSSVSTICYNRTKGSGSSSRSCVSCKAAEVCS